MDKGETVKEAKVGDGRQINYAFILLMRIQC